MSTDNWSARPQQMFKRRIKFMKSFDRKVLKANGLALFKRNYWKCVLVSFILAIVGSGSGFGGGSSSSTSSEQINNMMPYVSDVPGYVWAIVAAVIIAVIVIAVALSVFLLNPLRVGCRRYYLVNHFVPAELDELGFAFKNNYKNNVKTIFLMDLYTFLWSLLFVIPGIIKSYEYRMIPYIIAENPNIDTKDAFLISKQMMTGNKWDAFVLDLSFFGWVLLSVLTCGILAIFYVQPYIDATDAELFYALKSVTFPQNAPFIQANNVYEQPVYNNNMPTNY